MNNDNIEILDFENKPKEKEKFSVIKMYGEELVGKKYITNPAIARDKEIEKLMLVLLTPDKSALLTGKAGIGKTAIVEGLAYLIQRNEVPNALKGYKIIKINSTSLLGKITIDNNEEMVISILMRELKDVTKTILFIDEVHTLIGGKADGPMDLANILKPALDRGDIKAIGATTTEEYEAYIVRDRAFLRRFLKVDVAEPDEDQCTKILLGTYPKYEKRTGVKLEYTDYLKEKIFRFIVQMTDEYKRIYEIGNRYPDVALTIVMSAFSLASYENSPVVTMKHFYKAICRTKVVYEDAKVKEIARFKELFKDILAEENVDLNDM